MKKQKFLLGAAGLLALGLTACSNEMPVDNGKVAEADEIRYLRVAIANPPSTRAAEFQDGTDAENKVTSLYFKFYDATGKPVGDPIPLEKAEGEDEISFNPNTGTPIPSVGKIKEVVLQVGINRGDNYPAYVMCFINPVNFSEIGGNDNMYDLRDQKRDDYKGNDGAFAMNNSVYYGNDPISGGTNVKMSGTPIPADLLKSTQKEAEDAEEAVNIYVERYAAKVTFTLNQADDAIKTVSTDNGYTLTFVPEVWTVNADAPEMYAVKRYENSNANTDEIPTYADVQTMLGGWTTWNDEQLSRSYWACSPSYYATVFPQVSDNIIDQVTGTGTGAGELVGDYQLRYYSYNQIADQNSTNTSDGKGVTAMNNGGINWKYVLENTMGKAAFESLNPKAAAPSVLLVGHYDISNADGSVPGGEGFGLYNNRLYFRNQVPTGAPESARTLINALLEANQILAVNSTGILLKSNNATNVRDYFEVVHPNKAVRGEQAIPHRYVTLQLKEDVTTLAGLYYKPAGSDVWVSLATAFNNATTAEDKAALIHSVNLLLWQQIGNASAYTQSKCYYSIPIQHLGISENTTDPSPIVDGVIDWKKVRVGDFGLVRNHVYNIQVSGINGRASGIEDLNNPLVPSMDQTDYFVKYKVNILNWRVVPAQNNIILK